MKVVLYSVCFIERIIGVLLIKIIWVFVFWRVAYAIYPRRATAATVRVPAVATPAIGYSPPGTTIQ